MPVSDTDDDSDDDVSLDADNGFTFNHDFFALLIDARLVLL